MPLKLLLLPLLAVLPQPLPADLTVPPATAHIRLTAKGRGAQIYKCLAQDGGFAWVFQSPEAVLIDPATNEQVGTHSAGPTWTWKDGSSITGKVLQKQASSDPAAIPWLLLEAKPAGATTGALTTIAFVRRSDTQAGAPPAAGCDAKAAQEETTIRVPYVATYTFYAATQ